MVGPSVINRCPRWCCASSFAKSPGTTQEHYLKLHGTLPSCTTVNGSEIPRPTTTGWMFLKPYLKKGGINYSTSLNWWVYRDFWFPSTVSFDPLMTRGCLPDSPSNELVASIEGGRGKVWMLRFEFFAGSRSRCHFLFPKKNSPNAWSLPLD